MTTKPGLASLGECTTRKRGAPGVKPSEGDNETGEWLCSLCLWLTDSKKARVEAELGRVCSSMQETEEALVMGEGEPDSVQSIINSDPAILGVLKTLPVVPLFAPSVERSHGVKLTEPGERRGPLVGARGRSGPRAGSHAS